MSGSLLFLSTSDTDLLALAAAVERLPGGYGPVLARNPARLGADELAGLVARVRAGDAWALALRLLGGRRAFPEGFDALRSACRDAGVPLLAWPGEGGRDLELEAAATAPLDLLTAAGRYLAEGGIDNVAAVLRLLSDALRGTALGAPEPRPMPQHGIHRPPAGGVLSLDEWLAARRPGRPVVALGFYRAHWMSGNLGFVDELCRAIDAEGGEPLPFFFGSLRELGPDGMPPAVAGCLLGPDGGRPVCDALVLTTSFSLAELPADSHVAEARAARWLETLDVPVLQAVTCTSSRTEWLASAAGLAPIDVAMQVALPEFDGRIDGPPVSFKEHVDGVPRYVADPQRCRTLARLAVAHARLRSKPNADKRLAIVLSSYPTKNAAIGNAVGLDTPASALALLRRLAQEGYDVGELPAGGDQLVHDLIAAGVYDREHLTSQQMREAFARQPVTAYADASERLPASVNAAVAERWGARPGHLYVQEGRLHFAGLRFGNVILSVQPPRGFGEHPVAMYHDPDLPPTHHYVAFYRWLEEDYRADAVVHLGKHGTLEWLPGKAVGLSEECFTDALLPATPVFYPFIVNDPGEGVQAKRRGHSVVIDHLIPPMTRAEVYGDVAQLEQLMDEYYHVQTLDPSKLPRIQDRIWDLVQEASLERELGEHERPDDFDSFVLHIDGYLCELKDAQIRGGLHVLGEAPAGEALVDLLVELTRRSNEGVAGLRTTLLRLCGLPEQPEAGRPLTEDTRARLLALAAAHGVDAGAARDEAAALDAVHEVARAVVRRALAGADGHPPELDEAVRYVAGSLAPRLARTTDEIDNLLAGLSGRFVVPGPSGAPTRGMAHVLPTGRNFYSLDPKGLPTEVAFEVGGELAGAVLRRYVEDEGTYPETIGLVVWGTAAMRTHGDDVAEALHLLGVRPVWDAENRRVTGLTVVPAAELGRPRIDVVLRISGFFRDAFPNLVHLVDEAIERVAVLDEPDDVNFVAKHYREELAQKLGRGLPEAAARRTSLYRIFGSPPGTYGAGILPLIETGNWSHVGDLARAYEAWGASAYTRAEHGVDAVPEFRRRFAAINVAVKNQDNREHDILDSDGYFQFQGGMVATVRALSGRAPRQYHGDSADPGHVRVRATEVEVSRVLRTRAVNPRWVQAMMRHGYKGGMEMAATVEYLFGYDATAEVAQDWMYEGVARAYALDPEVQAFLREKNPWALLGIVRRLFEAIDRGMWERPPPEVTDELRRLLWELDAYLEEWGDLRRAAAGEES